MQVQKLRLQHGWSQEQLAELSGLNVRTIQRIERGQTPSVESLKALGAVFEVDFSELKEPHMQSPNIQSSSQNPLDTKEILALAHVRQLKKFYLHLVVYVVGIAGLAVINLMTYPHYLWFIYPALGWGLGIAIRALRVFDLVPFLGAKWEKSEVEKFLGRKL